MATITALGTAVATVILSIAPLVRSFRERGPALEPPATASLSPLHEAVITTLKDEMR